jgi:Uma2 family endonuclease
MTRDEYVVRQPVLIADVLSPSTASFDTGRKFALYQRLPSLRHSLTVDPDRVAVDHFERWDDGRWTVQVLGPEDRLRIPELGVDLPVPALYEGVPADAPSHDQREKA